MPSTSGLWAFPIRDSECSVLVRPDRGIFLLLNPTATWIYDNAEQPSIIEAYAEYFGVSLDQAELDVATTRWSWIDLAQLSVLTPERVFAGKSAQSFFVRLGDSTSLLHFETNEIAAEIAPRVHFLRVEAEIPRHTLAVHQEEGGYTLTRDAEAVAKEPLLAGVRAQLLLELTRLSTAGKDFAAVLHAGACGNDHAALVLAGVSHSGKSTLCAALMAVGWVCYADDSVPLDRCFHVVGMPFALMLREQSWPLVPGAADYPTFERYGTKVRFLPSNLPRNGVPSVPVRALVFVNYAAGGAPANLTRIGAFDVLVELQQSGFWVDHTQPSIAAFLAWLAVIPCYRLTYSAVVNVLPLLTNILDGQPLEFSR